MTAPAHVEADIATLVEFLKRITRRQLRKMLKVAP